jgi:hypothetical protein
MMIKAPLKIPALPRPAMARPTMRASEVGAVPQTMEPISKITIAVMYTYQVDLRLKFTGREEQRTHLIGRTT